MLPNGPAVERRRYRHRGAERLPGACGGVFLQKITDPEHILAATWVLPRSAVKMDDLLEQVQETLRIPGGGRAG
jgi:hypothetical protein